MAYRVGCVPYVNALPLIQAFREDPEESLVEVVFDVPSRLPALLEAGEVDAILVSSIYPLTTPGLRVAVDVGIASAQAVDSVRLFSRVPFDQIKTLATDLSSMTSNALAQIVLSESYGVQPLCTPTPPDLDLMLAQADAAILIGDKGMLAEPDPGVHVLDLGQAWFDLTGLPFVWALWVGREGLTDDLAGILDAAAMSSGMGASVKETLAEVREIPSDIQREILAEARALMPEEFLPLLDSEEFPYQLLTERREELFALWTTETGWERSRLEHYLGSTMTYELEEDHYEALERYAAALVNLGLAEDVYSPEWVGIDEDELEEERV